MTPLEVLQAIAGSGAAMSALSDSSCAVVGAEPPACNPDGTLVMVNDAGDHAPWPLPAKGFDFTDHQPVNPGHSMITLGDWVREAVNG